MHADPSDDEDVADMPELDIVERARLASFDLDKVLGERLAGLDLGDLRKAAVEREALLAAKWGDDASLQGLTLSAEQLSAMRPADEVLLEGIQDEMAGLRDVTVEQARNVAVQVAAAQRQSEQLDRLISTIEQSTKVTERLERTAVGLAVVAAILAAIQVWPIVEPWLRGILGQV